MDKEKFTWDREKCDQNIYENGCEVLTACGSNEDAAQRFVEALSEKIGAKCDFYQSFGSIEVMTLEEHVDDALAAISDHGWLSQFVVPFPEDPKDWNYFIPIQFIPSYR